MLIFWEFFKHNLIKIYTKTHKTAPYFKKISGVAYGPETLNHIGLRPTILKLFLYENSYFSFKNIHQNALIVTRFQKFPHKKYPI